MKQETNDILQSLEKELSRLKSAVTHIEQAKTVAQKVLIAVAGVQKKYSEHLDALYDLHKNTLMQLEDGSKTRYDEIGEAARRHIFDSAARAKKHFEEVNAETTRALEEAKQESAASLSETATRAEQIFERSADSMKQLMIDAGFEADKQISGIAENVHNLINELELRLARVAEEGAQVLNQHIRSGNEASSQHIDKLAESARVQVVDLGARAHKHIEELSDKAEFRLQELQSIVQTGMQNSLIEAKRGLENANTQSIKVFAAIKKAHDQHTLEFEKLSASTDGVIATSGKLARSIEAVDFPEKLQSIMNDIRSLHFNLNSGLNRVDALDKSMENSMRELADDIVGKLNRLELFIEKSIRSFEEVTERQFKQQRMTLDQNRKTIWILVAINILIAIGLYFIWSTMPVTLVTDTPPPQQTIVHDTVYVPVEAPAKRR